SRRIDAKGPKGRIPISSVAEPDVGRLRRLIPFVDRHARGARQMAGVKSRLIARIQIAYRTERGQLGDVDERILGHGRSLLQTLRMSAATWPHAVSARARGARTPRRIW